MGVDPKSIRKILITHHDIDHVGNVKYLRDITGAEVWAPADDIPYIMGEKSRPGVKHVFQFISKTGDPGEILPFAPEQRFGDLQVIPAPGHTPGHVIFIYQKIIFAGDLLRIINGVPAPMSKIMNADNAQALLSIGILKTLDFNWICPAHGQPTRMNEKIRKFINV